LWDPELSITATVENRHGNVDYTPYEGMTFDGRSRGGVRARGTWSTRTARSWASTARVALSSGSSPRRGDWRLRYEPDELRKRHAAALPEWIALYYERPMELVRGEGFRVWDSEGNEYLDFFGAS
jgi:hypothetical protein